MTGLIRCKTQISNPLGFHFRVVSRFVQMAQKFQSKVRVSCAGRVANGRSILDLMTLGAVCGDRLTIETSGPDAETASAELCALIGEPFRE